MTAGRRLKRKEGEQHSEEEGTERSVRHGLHTAIAWGTQRFVRNGLRTATRRALCNGGPSQGAYNAQHRLAILCSCLASLGPQPSTLNPNGRGCKQGSEELRGGTDDIPRQFDVSGEGELDVLAQAPVLVLASLHRCKHRRSKGKLKRRGQGGKDPWGRGGGQVEVRWAPANPGLRVHILASPQGLGFSRPRILEAGLRGLSPAWTVSSHIHMKPGPT